MYCPFCGSDQITVANSRPNSLGTQVWRRRKCLKCQNIFTTYEKIKLSYIVVVKKTGEKERYNQSKILTAIYKSFLNTKYSTRGEMAKHAEEITQIIENKILKKKVKQITSEKIQEIIYQVLRKKSPDAFLRYAVYSEGQDRNRLEKLLKDPL